MITIDDVGIEIEIIGNNFATIKETLSRIGISNAPQKKLFPSCYILYKKGKYYIVHFKGLFGLDGKPCSMSSDDRMRQSSIAKLLEGWSMINILSQKNVTKESTFVFVLPHEEKEQWEIKHKYVIGRKKL